jgi:hypothetical protein
MVTCDFIYGTNILVKDIGNYLDRGAREGEIPVRISIFVGYLH